MDARQEPFNAKCTPAECRFIARKAMNKFLVLAEDSLIKQRVKLFHALGNETRLRILALLAMREMCVCEIVEAMEGSTSTIIHHLRKLEDGQLVTSRQAGKFTLYSLNEALLAMHRIFD